MTDDDLDVLLRDHGTSWREANQDRPGIDWDAVTAARHTRTWLAVAGVAVAAAAVIVPVVLIVAGGSSSGPGPAKHPSPAPTAGFAGAPAQMFGIVRTGIKAVGGGRTAISEPTKTPVISLGVSPNDTVAYSTSAASSCRTRIQATFFPPPSTGGNGAELSGISRDVATIAGGQPSARFGQPPTAMAVSPDGRKLALVVTTAHDNFGGERCRGSEQLVVINLRTHAVRRWSTVVKSGTLSSLQWEPDSRHLAFLAQYIPMISIRSQVLDTAAPGHDYEQAKVVVLFPVSRVVFWWHGQRVTVYQGAMHLVSGRNGVGNVIASGFPSDVNTVSSDPTGDHLLLTSGNETYRWDDGVLSRVTGQWTQPGW